MSSGHWVWGRHVVEETLDSSAAQVLELCVLNGSERENSALIRIAKRKGARVRRVGRSELDRLCAGSAHQGLAARVSQRAGKDLDGLLAGLSDAERGRLLLVALDQIQDPHNFGAIARSAACLGAKALLVPQRRNAPASPAALAASAGALQKIPVIDVVNLSQALEKLKERGFWIYGADRSGSRVWDVRLNFPMVLVVGSEGNGLRPLVRSSCDEILSIPQSAQGVESLNASCAASVLLYEAARQAAAEMSTPCYPDKPGPVLPLASVFALTFVIFLLELVGGFWVRSLALVADAAHMAVDLAALGLGLFATWVARQPPDDRRTFGYHRVEVLAALGNGVGLWIVVGILLREAYGRLTAPTEVRFLPMLAIAVIGLLCNAVSAVILYRYKGESINMRAVFLHVMSDMLGSISAITAGLIMWKTGWMRADPLATALICVIISVASFRLVRDSIHILLEGAPEHLDIEAIRKALTEIEGVAEVHDLHLWSLSSGKESLSGHLVAAPGVDFHAVQKTGGGMLESRFHITHVTLQVERPEG